MKIAIIGGTGKEALGLALRLARIGEEIIIGSRQQQKAEQKAAELNQHLAQPRVRGLENKPAAAEADLAILTVPYAGHAATVSHIAEALRDKILIDTTVPLDVKSFRQLARKSDISAAEEAQQILGSATKVVAAFQNISHEALFDVETAIDCDVLVCGDDREARSTVIRLIERIGMRALDAGPLRMARLVEEITPLLIYLNRRYHSKRAGIRVTGIAPPGE
ncbi:MAG: NADPH-dependent F420 reductase [Acidobacteria bacterium]|nr:NADPH-dependent F420 reductase [Acidobacteriota bacterium]